MNGVIGMTEVLLDSGLTHEQKDYAETIMKSAEALLGLLNDITYYSYQNADKVYLEEDLDAGVFLDAKRERGEDYELVEEYQEKTPIREYRSYSPIG
jgi:signal transduction histidine kinase